MFTSIVFSKDRALQLDLTLKSIKANTSKTDINVIYTVSKEHVESYDVLMSEHEDVTFVQQSGDIFEDILNIVSSISDYVCFFTDDNIMYQKLSITEQDIELSNEHQIACISLRLGKNTTMRDYGDGILRQDSLPNQASILGNMIVWNRTTLPVGGYWSYPLSVDGHIFKASDMKKFVEELCVLNKHYDNRGIIPRSEHSWSQTPNEFEAKLQRFWFDLPPLMACPEHSCVVNSPNNRVQNQIKNRNGDKYNYVALDLRDEFEEGKRLSFENINFENIVCPHQELDILQGI
tara:strand:- start:16284 stop:17156 length:873 start_codon:yes stop_codon:yes gene_type:complete